MIVKLQQKEGIKKFKITSNLHFRVIQISSFNQLRAALTQLFEWVLLLSFGNWIVIQALLTSLFYSVGST